MRAPSPDEVWAARTAAGGWTRAQLAEWGVAQPPSNEWRTFTTQPELLAPILESLKRGRQAKRAVRVERRASPAADTSKVASLDEARQKKSRR